MEETGKKAGNRRRNRSLLTLGVVILVAAVLGGGYWFFFKRNRVTTDNAYAMADSARISSRVPGTVAKVLVENDRHVERGDLLVELDTGDYEAALEQAEGALAKIEADIRATGLAITLTDEKTAARLREAGAALDEARDRKREKLFKLEEIEKRRLAVKADWEMARRDFERFSKLHDTGAVARRRFDEAETAMARADARLGAIDKELDAVRASLDAISQEVKRADAQLQAARSERSQVEVKREELEALKAERKEQSARLTAARLNLSYCTIRAPISGYIAQKSIQVGDRIQVGQALMAVVPLEGVYVEANFKETQLTHVRLGQPAEIEADIYPGHTYHGKVVGIRAGTGAAFSLLPPENATGNWVKVVQRVPVKIELNGRPPPEHPLRVGLSLVVTINTRDRSGRMLRLHSSKP